MSGPKAEILNLKISGLYTDPNTFSEVPTGMTMAQANNVTFDKDSILNSRRGFPQYGVSPSGTEQIQELFDFKDRIIMHDNAGVMKWDLNNDGSVWQAFAGTYQAPNESEGDRMPSFQSNKNLYFGTSNGLYKLTSNQAQPRTAGVSRGLGGTGATTGSSGFMANLTQVAYRVIWGYRDENENLILGAPSDRIIVSNNSGTDANVTMTFFIPADIDGTYFYQVYRSQGSASLTTEPDDELQLVEQISPTPAQLAAGTVTFLDRTPDNLRGVLIYTASSLTTGGIQNGNIQPPFHRANGIFRNYAFYGNTRTRQILNSTLIAVGGTDGIKVNDTITFTSSGVGGTTFTITGKAAENAIAGEFKVTTALTPAENIDLTARSIVNVLNTIAANTIFAAYYTSGYNELPGHMQFERLNLDDVTFYVNSNNLTCFRPQLQPTGNDYNNTSRNEALQNRVYFSKLQQPEAVPILQYFDIASAEEPILAVQALRDGLIILKTDGVYRISGNAAGSFVVDTIDATIRCVAKHSVAVLNNKVFFYSTQGIIAVTENSAAILSRPIETQILQLSSSLYPTFPQVTFACGYEDDHKYILWTVSTTGDTQGTQAFVYNTITQDWSRWTKTGTAAIVKQENKTLYIAGPTVGQTQQYVFKERKTFTPADFADEEYDFTIVSSAGLILTVDNSDLIEVGYTIQQIAAQARVVEIIDSTHIKMDGIELWSPGTATAFRPIFIFFLANQIDAGDPGALKHWADCSGVFRETSFDQLVVGFTSDVTNQTNEIIIESPDGTGGWGTFPWGTVAWGVSEDVKARLRMSVPKNSQRSNWISIQMTLSQCFTDISLAGVALTFTKMSSRMKGASKA